MMAQKISQGADWTLRVQWRFSMLVVLTLSQLGWRKHKAGSSSFTYNDTFGKLHFKPKQNVYFLEDRLEFLDQAGEWFYNKTDKMLYVWTNDGASPQVICSDGSCAGHSYKQIHSVNFICNPWPILVIIIARDTYTYKDIDSTP